MTLAERIKWIIVDRGPQHETEDERDAYFQEELETMTRKDFLELLSDAMQEEIS